MSSKRRDNLRAFAISLGRGDGEDGPLLKAAIHIQGDRVVWGSRFMKWAKGKPAAQARRWLSKKGAIVVEVSLTERSNYATETPDKWKPVSWYRMDPAGLVVGFQGDTVTRCNVEGFRGQNRADLRRFCEEEGQSVSFLGTALREYIWADESGRVCIGINPPPSTVYATL